MKDHISFISKLASLIIFSALMGTVSYLAMIALTAHHWNQTPLQAIKNQFK